MTSGDNLTPGNADSVPSPIGSDMEIIQAQVKDLEAELAQTRKDRDDATLVGVDLERKIETMVEEMEFLKKIHSDVRFHSNDLYLIILIGSSWVARPTQLGREQGLFIIESLF